MRLLKFFAVLVAATGVVALVLVYAPSVSGQRADRPERHARELALLPGRGPEIGAVVRDGDGGVVVEDVRPDTPADKAGLKRGDVIVEFDGEHVRSVRQFTRLVTETVPDHAVKAVVQRNGKRTEVQVTPESRTADLYFDSDRLRDRFGDVEDMVGQLPFVFDFDMPGSRTRLGVTVQELTPQLDSYFAVKSGVLVSAVRDDSPAAKAGVKAGDVITAVNDATIDSRADLTRALREAAGDVSLTIVRDRKELTLKAKIEPRQRTTRNSRPI